MNRKRTWTIFIAAAVLLLSVGALAAGVLGGAEFFRSIFGETAEAVEPYISDPRLVAENDTHSLVVESLLTDGYQLRMIVSITGDMGESPLTASENRAGGDLRGSYIAGDVVADPWIALTDSGAGIDGYQVYEHAEFSTDTKRYYSIAAQSAGGFGPTLTVTSKDMGLSVEVTPSEALGTLSVAPAAADYASANFHPTTVRVSPMGVLVIGTEKVQQGGLPAPEVRLQYKTGKSELVIDQTYFDQTGDGTSMGGGGIILSGSGNRPLCEEVHGMRNPDMEVVLSGQFTRILNLNEVEAILVDGVAYAIG